MYSQLYGPMVNQHRYPPRPPGAQPRIAERDRQKRQVIELKGGQKAAAQQAAEEARQNEKRRMQEQRARQMGG